MSQDGSGEVNVSHISKDPRSEPYPTSQITHICDSLEDNVSYDGGPTDDKQHGFLVT